MESGVVRLFKVGFNIASSRHRRQITKNKVSSVLHALCMTNFCTKKRKQNNLHHCSQDSIYLSIFISFVLIPHNSQVFLP